jgi:hypothetical protein
MQSSQGTIRVEQADTLNRVRQWLEPLEREVAILVRLKDGIIQRAEEDIGQTVKDSVDAMNLGYERVTAAAFAEFNEQKKLFLQRMNEEFKAVIVEKSGEFMGEKAVEFDEFMHVQHEKFEDFLTEKRLAVTQVINEFNTLLNTLRERLAAATPGGAAPGGGGGGA